MAAVIEKKQRPNKNILVEKLILEEIAKDENVYKSRRERMNIVSWAERYCSILAEGRLTDITFMVGSEEDEIVPVHAVKSVLSLLVPFLEKLFNFSDPTGDKFRIERVNATSFRHIIEFAHTGTLSQSLSMDDLVDLVIASDMYLFEPLTAYCEEEIEVKMNKDTVWGVLDKLLESKMDDIAEFTVAKYLSLNTDLCLEDGKDFETATSKSMVFLLKLKVMNIESEEKLIGHCLKWAEYQRQSLKRENKVATLNSIMEDLLPHIRCFCVDKMYLADNLVDFYEAKDAVILLKYIISGTYPQGPLPESICSVKVNRATVQNLPTSVTDRMAGNLMRVRLIMKKEKRKKLCNACYTRKKSKK